MKTLEIPLTHFRITQRLPDFWALGKPGIAGAVLLTTFFGFLIGSPPGAILWKTLFHTLLGTALSALGTSALNMLLEQNTDALMSRTQNRPIPAGRIMPIEAFLLGGFFTSLGIVHLSLSVGMLPGFLSALTVVFYLVFYTPAKTTSRFNSFIGSVAGALPPLIGFSAAAGTLTLASGSLFAILFLWQFPHLISLGWIYREDNEKAGIKILPAIKKFTIASAGLLFLASLLPYFLGLSGPLYLIPASFLSGYYLYKSARFASSLNLASARGLFLASLVYAPLLLAFIVMGQWGLPSLRP